MLVATSILTCTTYSTCTYTLLIKNVINFVCYVQWSGKTTPSLFDSLVETSLIGKYDMPVKGTTPLGATKVISTGQQPMLGFYQVTKVCTLC